MGEGASDVHGETALSEEAHAGLDVVLGPAEARELARPGQEHAGPEKAARDILTFLLEDEEVNARYQRNKGKVNQALQAYHGGVLPAGGNLPIELEGYNLLRLEEYESTHVRFQGPEGRYFTIDTPRYRYQAPDQAVRGSFVPAIALPGIVASIADICGNPDHDLELGELEVDLGAYDGVKHWNEIHELTYQVLLVNGVIHLGSSETEVARFPMEVRKAHAVAQRICAARNPSGQETTPANEAQASPAALVS